MGWETNRLSALVRLINCHVSNHYRYFTRNKLDYPNHDTTRESRKYVKAMKQFPVGFLPFISITCLTVQEFIPTNNTFHRQFLDLLQRIFVYDPKQRITAKQALKHPWFKETLVDDGTEALRIGQQLQRSIQRAS